VLDLELQLLPRKRKQKQLKSGLKNKFSNLSSSEVTLEVEPIVNEEDVLKKSIYSIDDTFIVIRSAIDSLNFDIYSNIELAIVDSNSFNKMDLQLFDNMEGYPPGFRAKCEIPVIDRCDVWIEIETYGLIYMWKTSGICERSSQMSFDELQRNSFIWSVGEKDERDMTVITTIDTEGRQTHLLM